MRISEMKSDDSHPPSEKEMLLANVPLELALATLGSVFATIALMTIGHMLIAALAGAVLLGLTVWRFVTWQSLVARVEELSLPELVKALRIGLLLSGSGVGALYASVLFLSSDALTIAATCAWMGVTCFAIPSLFLGYRQLVLPFLASSALLPVATLFIVNFEPATPIAVALLLVAGLAVLLSQRLETTVKALQAANIERDSLKRTLESTRNQMNNLKATTENALQKHDTLAAKLETNQSQLKLAKGKAQALTSMLSRVTPYDNESGLLNAKKFKGVLSREWARMERLRLPISLIYIEINDFHRFKETYGEEVYAATLSKLANMISAMGRRPGDVAGRITDANFAVLLPEADEYNAENIARKFAEAVRSLNIDNIGAVPDGKLSISGGVTSAVPTRQLSVEKFLGRADQALENAKSTRGLKVSAVRYIQQTRVEYWNEAEHGIFSPEIVLPQLSAWGYSSRARTVTPDEQYPAEIIATDTIDTVLQGRLEVSVDGIDYMLTKGDRLYLPKKAKVRMRAKDAKSVVLLEAERYKVALVA